MEGAARAAKNAFDRDICLAWHIGAFSGAAFAGKLKSLKDYQQAKEEKQTPEQMLAILKEIKSKGAPMDIRKVN